MSKPNYKQIYAIQKQNEKRLLKLNPKLDDKPGIYFLTRENEEKIKFAYVGQTNNLLSRMCQHMTGYQWIDNSIKKHGLYSTDNPCGWRVDFIHFPISELDKKERHYITLYAKNGYQMRNVDTGGGLGKQEIGERKPPKTYRQGIEAGKKSLSKELSHIIDTHLSVTLKPGKENNKISQKALDKFWGLIGEKERENEDA